MRTIPNVLQFSGRRLERLGWRKRAPEQREVTRTRCARVTIKMVVFVIVDDGRRFFISAAPRKARAMISQELIVNDGERRAARLDPARVGSDDEVLAVFLQTMNGETLNLAPVRAREARRVEL